MLFWSQSVTSPRPPAAPQWAAVRIKAYIGDIRNPIGVIPGAVIVSKVDVPAKNYWKLSMKPVSKARYHFVEVNRSRKQIVLKTARYHLLGLKYLWGWQVVQGSPSCHLTACTATALHNWLGSVLYNFYDTNNCGLFGSKFWTRYKSVISSCAINSTERFKGNFQISESAQTDLQVSSTKTGLVALYN